MYELCNGNELWDKMRIHAMKQRIFFLRHQKKIKKKSRGHWLIVANENIWPPVVGLFVQLTRCVIIHVCVALLGTFVATHVCRHSAACPVYVLVPRSPHSFPSHHCRSSSLPSRRTNEQFVIIIVRNKRFGPIPDDLVPSPSARLPDRRASAPLLRPERKRERERRTLPHLSAILSVHICIPA